MKSILEKNVIRAKIEMLIAFPLIFILITYASCFDFIKTLVQDIWYLIKEFFHLCKVNFSELRYLENLKSIYRAWRITWKTIK